MRRLANLLGIGLVVLAALAFQTGCTGGGEEKPADDATEPAGD